MVNAKPMTDFQTCLNDILAATEPGEVYLIAADDLPWDVGGRDCRTVALRGLADVPADRIADLAVVDSAADVPDADVPILLSRLRDLSARRVLVIVREGASAPWQRRTLMGHGYTHYGQALIGTTPADLYQFDIATYKHTPDWLNPRNWANPELWDKHRW